MLLAARTGRSATEKSTSPGDTRVTPRHAKKNERSNEISDEWVGSKTPPDRSMGNRESNVVSLVVGA